MKHVTEIIQSSKESHLKLFDNINPQLGKVLSTIGFDKNFVRAQGASLFDDKGNEYYDFLAGYGVFAAGRNHPKIKAALKEAIDLDLSSLVQMDAPLLAGILAERLINMFGHGVRDTVFFTNSGTEANEGALKFAKAATRRDRFLCLEHAFHGLTLGSLSVNGNAEFRNGFGELLPSETVPLNDLSTLEEKLATRQFAAFIFEPVQGKGVYIPEKSYLREAVKLCHQCGTLVIADEVQTGLGRTGRWLACEHFDVEPDIITISKALSGGFVPVGAILYKRDIYHQVFSRMDRCVVHSNTFGKNALAMVCALTTLDVIEEEGLLQNAREMGDLLYEKLVLLKNKHDWIKDIRHVGLMFGIEFGRPDSLKKKLTWDTVHKLDKSLFAELIVMPLMSRHRILTQVSGHHQDIVKLLPPLMINETHVTHFVEALDDVLNDCDSITGPVFRMAANLAKHALT
ncbi:MAG: hypothetical protein ACD_62C00452G0003 [uncultured bacterium]|nr:MAG: hypothetical protein ACD_62C00452G0003 [uncultured bacterium]